MSSAVENKDAVAAEVAAKVDDEDFKAAMDGDDEGVKGDFEVTPEELALIRAELATEFPDDYKFLSDAYIRSVASKPYSKDPTVRRPLEYSQEKLKAVMKWREEAKAPENEDTVRLANGSPSAAEAVENPEKYKRATSAITVLNQGSMYWHGYTKEGNPILWVRTNRKPWYPDVEAEINALMIIADAGIRAMPEGVTDFVCIVESSYPPPPNPTYCIGVLKALVRGYPDRLKLLISAPVSSIAQFVLNLLLPLMPGRLSSKVVALGADVTKEKLAEMLGDESEIPTFFSGASDHDKFYPEESKCPNRGEGVLKFDYYGMLERMEEAKKAYEAKN